MAIYKKNPLTTYDDLYLQHYMWEKIEMKMTKIKSKFGKTLSITLKFFSYNCIMLNVHAGYSANLPDIKCNI